MGRKAGISRSEVLFRAEIALALSHAIGEERGAQSRAAQKLGISKQALSLYLRRLATPSSEILRRACVLWRLTFDVEGARVDSSSFRTPQPDAVKSVQMSLLDAISEIENQQVDVKILKKGVNSIDLKVTVDFGGTGFKTGE